MNAYTTRGQARIQPSDLSGVMRAYPLIGPSLAALEWQRGCLAEAEVNWLLKQNGVTSHTSISRVALLRQATGAVLVRAGERLAGIPGRGTSRESVPAVGPFGTAG